MAFASNESNSTALHNGSFATNLAAINAANAHLKAIGLPKTARAEYFSIEKHDNAWHALIIKPFPIPKAPHESLADQREGAFAFPIAAQFPLDQAQADALANEQVLADAQASATGKAPKEWIRSSSIMKPTKAVWAIADEMLAQASAHSLPIPSRKEIQDECVRRGVASGTARTQYQAWKTARDNALKNAEHAAALSAAWNSKRS